MDEIRSGQYAPQLTDNEQSLRAAIKYAYLAAAGERFRMDELPGGKGIAAVACIPAELSRLPVMVVELKGNKAAGGTIAQIKEKQYPAKLKPYAGQLLLVGMNYDEKTGRFDCLIEKE